MKRIFVLLALALNINSCLGAENIDILYRCIEKTPREADFNSRKDKCYTSAIKRIVKRCSKKIPKNNDDEDYDNKYYTKSKGCYVSEIQSVQDRIKNKIEFERRWMNNNYNPENYNCGPEDDDCKNKEYNDKITLDIDFYHDQIKFIQDRCSIYDKDRKGLIWRENYKKNKFICEIQELYQFDQFLREYSTDVYLSYNY